MIDILTTGTWFVLCALAGAGLLSAVAQLQVVRDRKGRTGQGWDARDTFEIQDALLGAVTWFAPIAALFVSSDWMKTLSTGQWWAAFLALTLPFLLFSIWYGRWSVRRRSELEGTRPAVRDEQKGKSA